MAKREVLCALALACAPVTASATTLFQDNFDTAASADRYDQFVFDRTGGNDASATFNFNYGAFHTWYTDLNGNIVSRLIPQAPHTTSGTSIGLRMDANNIPDATTPNTAVINLFPKLAQYTGGTLPSGDYRMSVDVWMNYNGPFEGGVGSTEHMAMGLNQTGGGVSAGSPVEPPTGNHPGLGWTINGERGNAFDYRYWRGSTRIGGTDALDPEVGQVAQDEGPGLPGPADGRNQFYQNAFPFTNPNDPNDIWYETPGSIGKHWTTLEMKYEDGIIYHYATPQGATAPILIAARTDDSAISGHIMLGYADLNNNSAAAETGDGVTTIPPEEQDASFVVFDNLLVESVSQIRQKWNFNGSGSWTDAHWDNGEPNDVTAVADFTTALSAPATISVNADRTVRSVVFNSANSYTINGPNTINLNSLTTGIFGTLKVLGGSHTINAPVVAARPTIFDVTAGGALTVNNFNSGSFRLVKNGAGVASVNNLRAPSVTVNAGTLRVIPNGTPSGVSLVNAVNIATGAKLDITDNKMIVPAVVDETAGTTTYAIGDWDGISHYTGLSGQIQSGRETGSGIVTGTATSPTDKLHSIGIAKVTDLHSGLTDTDTASFAGQTVHGSDTIVMATYGGDANLDGKINIDDYGLIDSHVGQSGNVFGWHNGDFNYDGKINIDDYGIIDGNIGAQGDPIPTNAGLAEGVTAVPEPASLALVSLLGAGLLRRRRRH